jgi:hypothetical protein
LARIFATPFCSKFVQTWARAGGKKIYLYSVRATSVLAFFRQNANAKSEFARFRKNIGGVCDDSFCARQGRSRRERPSFLLAHFLGNAKK